MFDFLTMRLLRDQIPGVGRRYIQFAPEQLVIELQKHSPLSQAEKTADPGGRDGNYPDGGENTLPAVIETKQPRAVTLPEAGIESGGDGGGSNST